MTSAWRHPWVTPSLVLAHVLLSHAHQDQRPSTSIRLKERWRKWTTCLGISVPIPSEPVSFYLMNWTRCKMTEMLCVCVCKELENGMLLWFGGIYMYIFCPSLFVCYHISSSKQRRHIFLPPLLLSMTCCPQYNSKHDIMHCNSKQLFIYLFFAFTHMHLWCVRRHYWMEIRACVWAYKCARTLII